MLLFVQRFQYKNEERNGKGKRKKKKKKIEEKNVSHCLQHQDLFSSKKIKSAGRNNVVNVLLQLSGRVFFYVFKFLSTYYH